MEILASIASKLPSIVWIVFGVVFILGIIVGVIKKVAKLAILVMLVLAIVTGVNAVMSGALSKYGVTVDGHYLSVKNEYIDVSVDTQRVKKVEAIKQESGEYVVTVTYLNADFKDKENKTSEYKFKTSGVGWLAIKTLLGSKVQVVES